MHQRGRNNIAASHRLLRALRSSCLLAGLLTGCGAQIQTRFAPRPSAEALVKEVEQVSKVRVLAPAALPASPGSLWPADDRVFFYGDKKALRVGDSLTIRIVETAQASNAANTKLDRKSSINATVNAFFGLQSALARSDLINLLDVTADNAHAGSGATSRAGKLVASMTAVVREVLPNGNLVVQGSRAVVVNNEEQYMTLTGIVRPQDIGRDNVVLSTQVADARITFGGVGLVADKQRSGWGTWIFDWVWPF
jgi:flagellar L-ring protein precursor FlgH